MSAAALSATFLDKGYGPERMARIMGLGTSITAGWGTGGQSWANLLPAQLALLEPEIVAQVINAGVASDTSAQMLARLPDLIAANPTYGTCVIEVPVNDGRSDVTYGASQAVNNMQRMITLCRAEGVTPIIVGTAPFDSTAWPTVDTVKLADINAAIKKMCAATGVVYIDLAVKFMGTTNIWTDGLHPNMAGDSNKADGTERSVRRRPPSTTS